jgi:transmembrane sensor
VTFSDPKIGELRVTASFKASEIASFMSALGEVVPVRTEETATGGYRLKRSES